MGVPVEQLLNNLDAPIEERRGNLRDQLASNSAVPDWSIEQAVIGGKVTVNGVDVREPGLVIVRGWVIRVQGYFCFNLREPHEEWLDEVWEVV